MIIEEELNEIKSTIHDFLIKEESDCSVLKKNHWSDWHDFDTSVQTDDP